MEIDWREMLRILYSGNALPISIPVDPNCEFQPGQIAQYKSIGNQVFISVSDGISPIGILDDIKSRRFSSTSINETSITNPVTGILNSAGEYVTPIELMVPLENPNIDPESFLASQDAELIPRNGLLIYPAGSVLNFDLLGSGVPSAIKNIVNYSYFIPNVPGDNSTLGSNRASVWIGRIIGATTSFDTSSPIPLNANLFCSKKGLFTTREPFPNAPVISVCTSPPNTIGGSLEFMWL